MSQFVRNQAEYYRGREQRERQLANDAVSPNIRRIHVEMAQQYATILAEMGEPLTATPLTPKL